MTDEERLSKPEMRALEREGLPMSVAVLVQQSIHEDAPPRAARTEVVQPLDDTHFAASHRGYHLLARHSGGQLISDSDKCQEVVDFINQNPALQNTRISLTRGAVTEAYRSSHYVSDPPAVVEPLIPTSPRGAGGSASTQPVAKSTNSIVYATGSTDLCHR